MSKQVSCRGCGKKLDGDGSQMNSVVDPDTRKDAKWNHYGGWVCSRACDERSSLELEQSMPGHLGQKSLSVGSESYRSIEKKWKD